MSWLGGAHGQVVEVAIGQVKGFFTPSDAERAAAYELLIELTTRPSGLRFGAVDVSIGDEIRSIEELFDITRSILRAHGTESSKGSAGNLSLAVVALRVLNEVFRPVVNRWRPLLDEHCARCPGGDAAPTMFEWELQWERGPQCRAELNAMRAATRAYIETLSRIAGTPSVAEVVLDAPSSAMMPPTKIDRRPDWLDESVEPRAKMVRWLDPRELWETAMSMRPAKRSLGLAAHREAVATYDADGRPHPTETFRVDKREEFWFDYVADMGDGFDGTAPVAWLMGRASLHIPDRGAAELPTPPSHMPRGRLVVFGGDEVYPVAKPGRYETQTELPFRMGLEYVPDGEAPAGAEARAGSDVDAETGDEVAGNDAAAANDGDGDGERAEPIDRTPTLIAIPGNHDWLGGIEHFEDMFVSQREFAGHWRTVQTNTYWHVKLPQGWWLWGIDTGLDNHLVGDPKKNAQEKYFRDASRLLRAGDRVVLCTPVPLWQLRQKHPDVYTELRGIFDPLIRNANATMPLCLSGDTHMFAHVERVDTDGTEDHVTSGGGGAFLQPTHNIPERIPQERGNAEFRLMHRWPLPADSRSLAPGAKHVLRSDLWPPNILSALLFLALAALVDLPQRLWKVRVDGPLGSDGNPTQVVAESARRLDWPETLSWSLASPWALLLLTVLALIGMMAFRSNSREPKLTKAARGYGVAAGVAWGAVLLVVNTTRLDLDLGSGRVLRSVVLAASAVIAGVGGMVAFFSMVKWSNRKIMANDTLALTTASSTRFKHFVRMRIDESGDLTCYVVGIDPVGKGWFKALTPVDGSSSTVPPYDPAGSPRLHYVWGKTFPKFVPNPLDIAISISDPNGTRDWTIEQAPPEMRKAVVEISNRLLHGGHTMMYGGVPGVGMTEQFHALDRKRHRDDVNWQPHLVNYVAAQYWSDDKAGDPMVRQIPVPAAEVAPGREALQNAANLTALRRLMADQADAWLVVGGDPSPGQPGERVAPGVLEEAFLALEAGVPLMVIGAFGGVGGLIARQLTGQPDHVEIDELTRHFARPESGPAFTEMLARFSAVGVLRNGLTDGENRELLRSRDPYTLTTLVLRSIHRTGATG